MNKGGGEDRPKLFSKGAGPELEGRSIPYLSRSEINHFYIPNVLILYCLVLYFFANPVTVF